MRLLSAGACDAYAGGRPPPVRLPSWHLASDGGGGGEGTRAAAAAACSSRVVVCARASAISAPSFVTAVSTCVCVGLGGRIVVVTGALSTYVSLS
mmetsp:Transcript_2244/g.6667  ORF Transcript_2244/g.6667 Transcript_2244/m.6667 type:complete len:95 (-) Transcript_2244:24-308(-)